MSDVIYDYNSVTITTLREQHHLQFDVLRREGDREESVTVKVIVPERPSRSLLQLQQEALQRAIEILQNALSRAPQ